MAPLASPSPASSTSPAAAGTRPARLGSSRRAAAVVSACYLLSAAAVTWHLWADPAARIVAGNPHDADLFAWFLRYDATAIAHGSLPPLVTAAMNAPAGVNLMWNTPMLLPGILLTPVTLLFGPQASLTVLVTAGFAGSAASMFLVLRRWQVSTSAAAIAGAVYGFSPALLQSAIGHYDVQFAVLPPLIIDAGLRLCLPGSSPWRDGARLGLLAAAQLLTAEELLASTAMAGILLVAALAVSRPREALRQVRATAAGVAVAAGVAALLAGYPLWVQFHGPLTQHGSAFTTDFFKNDLTGFITPSSYLLFHTRASAAAAAAFQGGPPEYLAYLGWPLIAVLAIGTVACWRHPAVRALALTTAVLALLSLGGHPLVGGVQQTITLPWHWLEGLPVTGSALPDRLSVIADGTAAALLAFSLDQARSRLAAARRRRTAAGAVDRSLASDQPLTAGGSPALPWLAGLRAGLAWLGSARGLSVAVTAVAVLAVAPLLPRPLTAATAAPVPAGWTAVFAALHLPRGAPVLIVPVPTANLTGPLRWQADTGQPSAFNGGYFVGPAWNGQAYIDGNGVAVTAQYLDQLWSGGPPGARVAAPSLAQLRADMAAWRPAAVVAVTSPRSALGRYLTAVFGRPSLRAGRVLGWQ